MKNNRGAISIETIITVIVIILLLGVTIFMLTGENGLFVLKDKNDTDEMNKQNVYNQNTVINNDVQNQNNINNENVLITIPAQ